MHDACKTAHLPPCGPRACMQLKAGALSCCSGRCILAASPADHTTLLPTDVAVQGHLAQRSFSPGSPVDA